MRFALPARVFVSFGLLLAPGLACDCGGAPTGGGDGGGGGGVGAGDAGGGTLADGGDQSGDGGGQAGGDGGGDGGGGDAGDPLEQPISDFCAGSGAPVLVGEGNACAGEIAENTFRFALCACEDISLGGALIVDSFDSSLGAHGATLVDGGTNVGDDGQLGTNSGLVVDRKITVRGSAFIGGAAGVQFGPGSEVTQNLYSYGPATAESNTSAVIGRNAFINGDVSDRYTVNGVLHVPAGATVEANVDPDDIVRMPIPEQLPCACEEDEVLDVAALTAWAATHNDNELLTTPVDGGSAPLPGFSEDAWADPTVAGPAVLELPCGRYYLSGVDQTQGLTVRATGRVVLFVDGPFRVGGITIDVEEGGELDLFVAGDVAIGSAASFGSKEQPSLVRTYVGGNMTLSASAEFAGNVYAPNAIVQTNASTRVYGSLFVRSVSFGASAELHFDSAIRRAGEACGEDTPGDDAGTPGDDGGAAPGGDGGGSPGADGGVTPAPDAGVTPAPDAGVTPAPDAGVEDGCSGRCDPICGLEACLVDPDTGSGQCGPCGSDLDCCAPALCLEGQCVFIGG